MGQTVMITWKLKQNSIWILVCSQQWNMDEGGDKLQKNSTKINRDSQSEFT